MRPQDQALAQRLWASRGAEVPGNVGPAIVDQVFNVIRAWIEQKVPARSCREQRIG